MGGRNVGREEISESASMGLHLRVGWASRKKKKKTQVALCGHGAYTSFSVLESEEKPGRSLIAREAISCLLSSAACSSMTEDQEKLSKELPNLCLADTLTDKGTQTHQDHFLRSCLGRAFVVAFLPSQPNRACPVSRVLPDGLSSFCSPPSWVWLILNAQGVFHMPAP